MVNYHNVCLLLKQYLKTQLTHYLSLYVSWVTAILNDYWNYSILFTSVMLYAIGTSTGQLAYCVPVIKPIEEYINIMLHIIDASVRLLTYYVAITSKYYPKINWLTSIICACYRNQRLLRSHFTAPENCSLSGYYLQTSIHLF